MIFVYDIILLGSDFMPKVIFKRMEKEDNISFIKECLNPLHSSTDIINNTISYFPELSKVNDSSLSNKEKNAQIADIVSEKYDNSLSLIDSEIDRCNNLWKPYSNNYFKSLCSYFNISWPHHNNIITIYIGLIPIFPRYLDDFSFYLTPNVEESELIRIIAHEILHFAWFTKWHELYPKCPKNHYDSPYLPWLYSEMVTDSILNSTYFQEVFNHVFQETSYAYFYDLKSNNELVMSKLKSIYESNLPIDKKIITGYEYLKGIKDTKLQ